MPADKYIPDGHAFAALSHVTAHKVAKKRNLSADGYKAPTLEYILSLAFCFTIKNVSSENVLFAE